MASIKRLLLLCSLILSGCAISAQESAWQSPLYSEHPLVGTIFSSASGEEVSRQQLWSAFDQARYIMLGEKHDNPDHHALQLQILNSLIERNQIDRLTLEMLDSTASAALQDFNSQEFADSQAMLSYLNWDEEGWDWNFYGPLVDAAHRAAVPLLAGNISGETVGRVYSEPTPAAIASVFDEEVMQQLFSDIDESHCGLLPESQFPSMVRVQQTRDYTIAQQMTAAADDTSVLIAGNYHVRHDLGVPNYLLANDAALSREEVLSLAFIEVQPDEEDPASYLDQFGNVPAYDYIWFTPVVSNVDYCASLQ